MTDEERTTLLIQACRAALAYDRAIQEHARYGKSWVASDLLDKLYEDWLAKATKALEGLEQ